MVYNSTQPKSPIVTDQKKNTHNFMEYYPNLCRFLNITPDSKIELNSSNKFLDFVGDRIKPEEWKPILEAISNDRCLHFISIRSKHNKPKGTQVNLKNNQSPKSNTSCANFTDDIVVKLTEALSKCLTHSSALTALLLEKLPLGSESINYLSRGLEVCRNLQQLSLPYCKIGDDGCASLCYVLRRRLNIVWLNLSGCCLTEKGIGILCDLLKFQKLNRYGESWKQSLRYRPVNPNSMPGLRRLTLNHNPVGDEGIKIIVETLIDDLWLKALDLQDCDITLLGGELILNLIKENQFLSVLDIRSNAKIPKSMIASVVQQLAENNADVTPEFQWLNEDDLKKTNSGSSIRTSASKSTVRFLSNTTLSSKVPPRAAIMTNPPLTEWQRRARSASSTRPRGITNQPVKGLHNIKTSNNSELNSLKNQLEEVKKCLEEEIKKRKELEQQLELYKQVLPENLLANIAGRKCSAKQQNSKNELEQVELQENKKDSKSLENVDSLDFLIETVNEGNASNLRFRSKSNISLYRPDETPDTDSGSEKATSLKDAPSRAQHLFQCLISS